MTFRLLKSLAKQLSRRVLNSRLTDFIKSIPEGSKVLNIGSGGEIVGLINSNKKSALVEVFETDIDPERNPDFVDDIVNTKLKKESFDYIVCAEVLEHVTHPHLAADNLFKLLKKGGKCFVSTPYLFPTHDAPYDHFRFTEFGLKHLFSKFEITSFVAKTTWWETLVLLAWRQMWLDDTKAKYMVLLLSVILLPILPIFYVFSKGYKNMAMTAGFVLILRKV